MVFCCLSFNTQNITQITRHFEKLKSRKQRSLAEAVIKPPFQQSSLLKSLCQALLASSSSSTADYKSIDLFFRFPSTNPYKILAQSSRDFHFSFPLRMIPTANEFPRCHHCAPSRMPQQLRAQAARLHPKVPSCRPSTSASPLSEGFRGVWKTPPLGDMLTKA